MRSLPLAALLCGAVTLAGCATLGLARPGDELVGETLTMRTARGQTTRLFFEDDGTVRATFGERALAGRWSVENRNLCFYWTGAPRECWPYPAPFRPGETRTVTSDRGNVVRVTRP